jgi:hypothetical protein
MARFGDASQQPSPIPRVAPCLHSYLSPFSSSSSQIKPSTQPLSSETLLIMVGANSILCNKPGRPCAPCKSTAYCSVECQQTDWPLHKLLCKKFSSFSPRPDSDSKLGLYFPVDSKVPELIWVNCAELNVELQPHFQLYMGRDIPYSEEWPIGHRIFRSIQLDPTVVTYSRHNLCSPGSAPNLSIKEGHKGSCASSMGGSCRCDR